MENCRCLPRASSPLNKQQFVFRITNNFILFPLDRRYNAFHLGTGMVTKRIKEHLVAYLFVGIKDGYNYPIFNLKLAFKSKIYLLLAYRSLIFNLPKFPFIVNRRNRCSPVIHKKMVWLVGKGSKPDIYLFRFVRPFFTKINAGKVRLLFKTL